MATKKARKAAPGSEPGVTLQRCGISIMLFCPRDDAMRSWLKKHTRDALWSGGSLAVDMRYAWDLAQGIQAAGYTVA